MSQMCVCRSYNICASLPGTGTNVGRVLDAGVDELRFMLQTLKSTGLWKNTVFVWTTDNGSPVQAGGSNHPRKSPADPFYNEKPTGTLLTWAIVGWPSSVRGGKGMNSNIVCGIVLG